MGNTKYMLCMEQEYCGSLNRSTKCNNTRSIKSVKWYTYTLMHSFFSCSVSLGFIVSIQHSIILLNAVYCSALLEVPGEIIKHTYKNLYIIPQLNIGISYSTLHEIGCVPCLHRLAAVKVCASIHIHVTFLKTYLWWQKNTYHVLQTHKSGLDLFERGSDLVFYLELCLGLTYCLTYVYSLQGGATFYATW